MLATEWSPFKRSDGWEGISLLRAEYMLEIIEARWCILEITTSMPTMGTPESTLLNKWIVGTVERRQLIALIRRRASNDDSPLTRRAVLLWEMWIFQLILTH